MKEYNRDEESPRSDFQLTPLDLELPSFTSNLIL